MSTLSFLMIRQPPRSTRTDTLFPYPTRFRSFGRDGILDSDAVLAVADYAKTLSDPAWAKGRAASVASGREVFAANCVVCHGEQGRGSQQLGAPNLTDQDRNSVVSGKRVSVRVGLGGRRILTKNKSNTQ